MTIPELLVVDDNKGVREMLGIVLRQQGFAVHLADGGAEAVELFRRYRDTIGLVLLHVQMTPLDGPAVLGLLRDIDPQVRVAFMSASSGRYTAKALTEMGAVCVLEKPFAGLDRLVATIRQLVGPHGQEDGQ